MNVDTDQVVAALKELQKYVESEVLIIESGEMMGTGALEHKLIKQTHAALPIARAEAKCVEGLRRILQNNAIMIGGTTATELLAKLDALRGK